MIGFINIDKQQGMTSFDVVRKIKKLLDYSHIGHLGTLDPLATGVLPIAVGKATKLFDYFLNKDKVYEAEFCIGIETDTLDVDGKIIYKSSNRFNDEQLKRTLENFIGEIEQIPPKFSAIKIDGERAYKLARSQKEFSIPSRKVKIYAISTQSGSLDNLLRLKIHCQAGTYIRTLGYDICKSLGTVCAMKNLRRISAGNFHIEDSVTLENFEKNKNLIPIQNILSDLKIIHLTDDEFYKLKNGQQVFLNIDLNNEFLVYGNNVLYGLAKLDENKKIVMLANLYEGD